MRGAAIGITGENLTYGGHHLIAPAWGNATVPPDAELTPTMTARLLEIQNLCVSYGSHFTFLILGDSTAGDTAIVEARGGKRL